MNHAVYSEGLGTGAAIRSSRSSERKKRGEGRNNVADYDHEGESHQDHGQEFGGCYGSEHLFRSKVYQCLYKDDVYHRPQNRDQSENEKVPKPIVSGSSKSIAQLFPAGAQKQQNICHGSSSWVNSDREKTATRFIGVVESFELF